MRMCMEEVEKRGLNTRNIYSYSAWIFLGVNQHVLRLQHMFESEKSFSFRSTDDIHSVAKLLMRYILDLPEPLFSLSLQEYRNYRKIRANYIGDDFSLLRAKIRELDPVHRASLGALLRHLLLVASHSDQNEMAVEALAAEFREKVFRGNEVLQEGVHMKVRCTDFLQSFRPDSKCAYPV
ncbi:Rho GTPase activation protein [Lactarius quietus]|nr:Rho GTPase activation protein [Lactarius quietus]